MIRFVIFVLTLSTALAHQVSQSFLSMRHANQSVSGHWAAALRDLEVSCGLDTNHDDQITWGEIRAAKPRLAKLLNTAVALTPPLPLQIEQLQIDNRPSGKYLLTSFSAHLPAELRAIDYSFMFEYDQFHQGFVSCQVNATEMTSVLTSSNRKMEMEAEPTSSFAAFLKQGVIHIWKGIDHLCFLFVLLLPAVLAADKQPSLRTTLFQISKIVSAFTLAHSITLSLAALQFVRLPSALVESIIALSVIFAAVNNVAPFIRERTWVLAFGFGLLHGFGFASVLTELNIETSSLLHSLLAFNLGVETGQLIIVLLIVPIAFLIRESWCYRKLALQGGSWTIALIGLIWLVERTFSVAIFSTVSYFWQV